MPSHVNALDAPTKVTTIKVGGSDYEIQWGPLAEYILSVRGLTTNLILEHLNKSDPRTAASMVEMIGAFTAHSYKATEAPTTREWAARLLPGELGAAFQAMRGLLIDSGVWRALPPKNAPAPTPEPHKDQAPTA